jgi:hypothetical protein
VKSTRQIFALPILGTALALIGFGIAIGVRPTGPGKGVRLSVVPQSSEPAARQLAHRVLKERLDFRGVEGRITPAGDRLIVEIGSTDEQVVSLMVELIERRAEVGSNMPAPPPTAAALDAAAAPPMTVTKREPFSRSTGFLPRAWPFLAFAGVLLVIAGVLWLRSP